MSSTATPARALLESASRARQEKRLIDALQICREAAAASRKEGDADLLIGSLRMLGQLERDAGRPAEALESYQEAVELCRATGSRLRLAHAVRHLGDLFFDLQRPIDAAVEYASALDIYRNDPKTGALDLANALRGYALVHEVLGDSQSAAACWQEARTTYADLGIEAGVAECDDHLNPNSHSGEVA